MKYKWTLPTSIFFLIAFAVIILDQMSKMIVRGAIEEGRSVPVISKVLYITHATNTGASFSMLTEYSLFLTVIAAGVILGIVLFYKKIPAEYRIVAALILGGTAGNLIDRFQYGFVVDFLDVRIWPIFNVADMAITLAAILLLIIAWKETAPSKNEGLAPKGQNSAKLQKK